MKEADFIKMLRGSVSDKTEPFVFAKEEIETYIKTAVGLYSKCKPTKKVGHIDVVPNVNEYSLPENYQTWITGLEGYCVLNNKVLIWNSNLRFKVNFVYYADRTFDEIPERDIPLILEYCQSEIIESIVINTTSSDVDNSENITAINLGKGLNITFEDTKTLEKELYCIAKNKKEHFLSEIKNTLTGGWC